MGKTSKSKNKKTVNEFGEEEVNENVTKLLESDRLISSLDLDQDLEDVGSKPSSDKKMSKSKKKRKEADTDIVTATSESVKTRSNSKSDLKNEDMVDLVSSKYSEKKKKKFKEEKKELDSDITADKNDGAKKLKRKTEPEEETSNKKKKKDSQKTSKDETTNNLKKKIEYEEPSLGLGVVDTSILKQAATNHGLPTLEKEEDEDKLSEPKTKKKKKKKGQTEDKSSSETQASLSTKSPEEKALNYLNQWHKDKKNWKFCKHLQIKLLHMLYDSTKMDDEAFSLMLLYLEGLNGKGREKTKEEAQKMLADAESETNNTIDATQEERARQVFQLLS